MFLCSCLFVSHIMCTSITPQHARLHVDEGTPKIVFDRFACEQLASLAGSHPIDVHLFEHPFLQWYIQRNVDN